ncbi:hypothetical protein [Rhizobium leguminosarum]|uniref:hypothetical protein n=1 Tax=Rhizobium leguminosarum TaxID=384 RepID=UPI001C93A68D|nr:hypothetical protein [Rhizobium leguminosarum]MBY5809633.1 hypothetical protein [Rhizobium leguminosarum]
MDDDDALEAAAEFPKRCPAWCWRKVFALALELNNPQRFPPLSGAIRRSGDGGINLREKFPKVLKNDSF